MQQHQHQFIRDRRRPRLMDTRQITRYDDFYTKLERIRLSAAASSSKHCIQRSATELLDESKAFFVKSQEVLRKRQSLITQPISAETKSVPNVFRIANPRRSPYQDVQSSSERIPVDSLDLALHSSTPSTTITSTATTRHSYADGSDSGLFESVSLLSLSDQTTLDSSNSPSAISRTVVPSSALTVIERNARIIKWLFQLNKANGSPSFQTVQ